MQKKVAKISCGAKSDYHFLAVCVVDGMDEDEMLNASLRGGVERVAEQFPM